MGQRLAAGGSFVAFGVSVKGEIVQNHWAVAYDFLIIIFSVVLFLILSSCC